MASRDLKGSHILQMPQTRCGFWPPNVICWLYVFPSRRYVVGFFVPILIRMTLLGLIGMPIVAVNAGHGKPCAIQR